MRYPEFLKKNGKIGIIAPSFGCVGPYYGVRFDAAVKNLAGMGFNIEEGPNCRLDKGVGKSNTAVACAAEINEFFLNNDCDVIISAAGGETMCEDVSFVDFEKIKNAPAKWFMGYSDNTNLTFTLATLCDTASVYGPNATSFGMEKWHESLFDALKVLKGDAVKDDGTGLSFKNYDLWEKEGLANDLEPLLPLNVTEKSCIRSADAVPVKMSGRLLGGCLDCLVTLCGTKFDKVKEFNEKYADDGIIWFLESCDLNPIAVRRALWQMKNAGWFDKARGFIIGRPFRYGEECFGLSFDEAVKSMLSELKVPIIFDADIGHLPPQIPMITGAFTEVSFDEKQFIIDYTLR